MPDRRDEFAIAHVALLARLRLTAEEEGLYSKQLAEIVGYASRILAVDFGVAATPAPEVATSSPGTGPARADQVQPSLARDTVLDNAPDPAAASGLIRVPKVIG